MIREDASIDENDPDGADAKEHLKHVNEEQEGGGGGGGGGGGVMGGGGGGGSGGGGASSSRPEPVGFREQDQMDNPLNSALAGNGGESQSGAEPPSPVAEDDV